MSDIKDREDVKLFVDQFYGKIQNDEVLAPVFALRIEADSWQEHLEKMYGFWATVLSMERTYRGNPFAQHMALPIKEHHFNQWLKLFSETIDEHFSGEKADEVKLRAEKMAAMFKLKFSRIAENPDFKGIV